MKCIIKLLAAAPLMIQAMPASAQKADSNKEKKTTITITTEENGKRTVIDTTFYNASPATIDAFLQQQGVSKPIPPAPPVPPVPPSAEAPAPPSPPGLPDDKGSYFFKFDMPDFKTAFDSDMKDQLENLDEILEHAREEMKESFDKMHFNKEELRDIMDDVKQEMEKVKKEMEKDGNYKKMNIRKKTSEYKNDGQDDVAFNNTKDHASCYSYLASSSDEPMVITRKTNPAGHFNYVTIAKPEKVTKSKKLLNKIVEKILE